MTPRYRFSVADVRRAGALARLALSSEEIERFAAELAPVLDGFERIEASGPPPELASRERHSGRGSRSDAPDPDTLHVRPSEFAPDWRDGFFVVPRLPALDR
ncbi:MAG: aspartyl/glutamyl-tRNA amidotransferase subunit C [Gemmatimonadales bacterium]